MCICDAETCFSCGKTWQTCDYIRPDHNAVTDELGRAIQAQIDSRRLAPILQNPRRRLGVPVKIVYENFLTDRLERHLAEVKRIRLGIRAITASGGLRSQGCRHERWVLHEMPYGLCDICGNTTTGFVQSCIYCLVQVCRDKCAETAEWL